MPKSCPTCSVDLDNIKIDVHIDDIRLIAKRTGISFCMECGKCTSTCPVALLDPEFSPRKIASKAITGGGISLLTAKQIWSCLTCGLCNEHCPSDVRFVDFITQMRSLAGIKGQEAPCSHGGAMQSLMKLMTAPDMKQNRLDWLTNDLKTSKTGDYALFVGCLPYYDAYFDDLKLDSVNIAKSAIRILNHAGIVPAVMDDERCCGHDLKYSGDVDIFRMLIDRNVKCLSKTKAKTIITTCAECFRTLKFDYPDYSEFPFKVKHISEFISENADKIKTTESGKKVTFHDPCRLSRHAGVIDAPRTALESVGELVEMPNSKRQSQCCGTSSWMNCDIHSKMRQAARLKEAISTGADLLVTSCPKCMIHFKCAQNDPMSAGQLEIEIKDLAEIVAENLAKMGTVPVRHESS